MSTSFFLMCILGFYMILALYWNRRFGGLIARVIPDDVFTVRTYQVRIGIILTFLSFVSGLAILFGFGFPGGGSRALIGSAGSLILFIY